MALGGELVIGMGFIGDMEEVQFTTAEWPVAIVERMNAHAEG